MRSIVTSLAVLICICAVGMTFYSPFQGKWKVHFTPDDAAQAAKEKESDDVLVFTPTTVTATAFDAKHGFKPANYEEDIRRFGPAAFTASGKSDTDGTSKWSGTITADAIRGELVWTKKDGTALTFTYTGEKSTN